jgi:hypothetical protein
LLLVVGCWLLVVLVVGCWFSNDWFHTRTRNTQSLSPSRAVTRTHTHAHTHTHTLSLSLSFTQPSFASRGGIFSPCNFPCVLSYDGSRMEPDAHRHTSGVAAGGSGSGERLGAAVVRQLHVAGEHGLLRQRHCETAVRVVPRGRGTTWAVYAVTDLSLSP